MFCRVLKWVYVVAAVLWVVAASYVLGRAAYALFTVVLQVMEWLKS